ncbi:hypothetical protein [Burkholderia pseudomallei]|uniref:hypothetical protein n=1 Tax=Burkholderia pseudomallei TaxID=28450 RepID=UPI000E68E091|nr:hypothetical protein [Burkholderia pseudomallei]RIV77669.1 hypothetical protein D2W72_02290 [Burkholderia pseudomallei]RIV88526.1 hypothetical protein D2V84_00290 [Burkholderia pseudomallei]
MTPKRKKSQLAEAFVRFVRQYARKAQPHEPNDRQYDRKLEAKMKRLSPSELSSLLTEDADEAFELIRNAGRK